MSPSDGHRPRPPPVARACAAPMPKRGRGDCRAPDGCPTRRLPGGGLGRVARAVQQGVGHPARGVADPARAAAPLAGALLRLAAAGGPFRWARPARNALAGLLRRDITAPVRKPWSAYVDLDEVRVLDARVFLGPVLEMPPLLACSVLDLAAADAPAGCPLAERVRAWPRISTCTTRCSPPWSPPRRNSGPVRMAPGLAALHRNGIFVAGGGARTRCRAGGVHPQAGSQTNAPAMRRGREQWRARRPVSPWAGADACCRSRPDTDGAGVSRSRCG
jgi:hypothetical protein